MIKLSTSQKQVLGGGVLLLLSGFYGLLATQIPLDYFSQHENFNAQSLPKFLSGLGCLFAGALVVDGLRLPTRQIEVQSIPASPEGTSTQGPLWQVACLLLSMIGYSWAIEPWGFVLASVCFLALAFFIMGERRWYRILLWSTLPVGGFWLIFTQILGVTLH